jgi:hypothetical protein
MNNPGTCTLAASVVTAASPEPRIGIYRRNIVVTEVSTGVLTAEPEPDCRALPGGAKMRAGTGADLFRASRNVARWFAHEFLTISFRLDLNSALASACRLTSCLMIAGLTYAQLYGRLSGPPSMILLKSMVALGIALAVGWLAKEFAFLTATSIANSMGRDFTRRGVMLSGKEYQETQYADGTWSRCETGRRGTVHEWVGMDGKYNRTIAPTHVKRSES